MRGGFSVLVVMGLLAGCATQPRVIPLDDAQLGQAWEARHAQLSELNRWSLSGRVAVRSDADSWSAGLRWQQFDEAFDIRFSSLLGQQMARLKGDALMASLYLPDERVLTASNLSELLDEELGWHVPLSGLRYWVLGLPAPGDETASTLDAQGRLAWLEQSGWRVEYRRYQSAGILELPEKITLTHGNLRVRLVVDRWQPSEQVARLSSDR